MNKLVFFTLIFVFLPSLDGMELEAVTKNKNTMTLKNRLEGLQNKNDLLKLKAICEVDYPIYFGGKQLYPEDISDLDETQRKIFFDITQPSCLARCQGANHSTIRTCDIDRIDHQRIGRVLKGAKVMERKEKPCIPDCGFCGALCIVPVVGCGIALLSFFPLSCGNPVCPLMGKVMGGLAGGTASCEGTIGLSWLLQKLYCYTDEPYEFK
jgi:hypothetical protein